MIPHSAYLHPSLPKYLPGPLKQGQGDVEEWNADGHTELARFNLFL